MRDEAFHIYAVKSVDEGLTMLSKREAGLLGADGYYPDGSFNDAVRQALLRNVERLKTMRGAGGLAATPRPGAPV